jgi:hypothetical protein
MTASLLDRFFDHLRQRPNLLADARRGRVLWPLIDRAERANERVEFSFTEAELRVALQQRQAAAISLWPEVPAEVAAFRLLYTSMMECAESDRSRTVRRFRLENGAFLPWDGNEKSPHLRAGSGR